MKPPILFMLFSSSRSMHDIFFPKIEELPLNILRLTGSPCCVFLTELGKI